MKYRCLNTQQYPALSGDKAYDGRTMLGGTAIAEWAKTHPEDWEEVKEVDQLRPEYHGGKDDPYETIKVIRAWGLNFELGNVLKYIRRLGGKDNEIQELVKARTYIDMEIERRQNKG